MRSGLGGSAFGTPWRLQLADRAELRDPLHHEYFAYAPVAGRNYLDYKGSEFKGFFHLPRYFLTVIETIDRMLEGKK